MIELAIYDHLRNSLTGDVSDPVRQSARQQFIHLAGNVVYLGRIPENSGPIGVAIRRVEGGEVYNVLGEEPIAQPFIEFLIIGRDQHNAKTVLEVADNLRLIFSGYRGALGDIFCYGATVELSQSLSPRLILDGSDRWQHAYILDIRFSVTQAIPTY